MPKLTKLVGYDLMVADKVFPVIDNGQPVFEGGGAPKTEVGKLLTFREPETGDTVMVDLPADAVSAVVKALTGGIEIASSITEFH